MGGVRWWGRVILGPSLLGSISALPLTRCVVSGTHFPSQGLSFLIC